MSEAAQNMETDNFWKPLEKNQPALNTDKLKSSIQYGTQEDYTKATEKAVEPVLKDLAEAFKNVPDGAKQIELYADDFRSSVRKFKEHEKMFANDPRTWQSFLAVRRKALENVRDMAKKDPDNVSLHHACDTLRDCAAHFDGARLYNEHRAREYFEKVSNVDARSKEIRKLTKAYPQLGQNELFMNQLKRLESACRDAAVGVATVYNHTKPTEDAHPALSYAYMREADSQLKALNRNLKATEKSIATLTRKEPGWELEPLSKPRNDTSIIREMVAQAKDKAESVAKTIGKLVDGVKKAFGKSLANYRDIKGAPDMQEYLKKAEGAGLSLAQIAHQSRQDVAKGAEIIGKHITQAASQKKIIETAKRR